MINWENVDVRSLSRNIGLFIIGIIILWYSLRNKKKKEGMEENKNEKSKERKALQKNDKPS